MKRAGRVCLWVLLAVTLLFTIVKVEPVSEFCGTISSSPTGFRNESAESYVYALTVSVLGFSKYIYAPSVADKIWLLYFYGKRFTTIIFASTMCILLYRYATRNERMKKKENDDVQTDDKRTGS